MEGALCLMQIWIHDKSMRKVCALNNEIPGMLPYTNSQWHPYLEYSTSTFDFTIPKIVNRKLHDDIKYINDQMFVSFYFDNSYHVFYVSKLVENDFSFQVTCNNTNLELAMEVARPLADSGGPKTIEWYLQNLELLGFAGLEIGVNEISDRTRTLTFESQSGTKLEQLHSLMNQFDAEFVFRTDLNRDGTLKKFVIDIYQEADENHHGIGKARGDVTLYYQTGLKGVQVTSDKTQLFNAGNFIGQDGVNLNDVEFEEKNELGQVEFYSRKGTSFVFAPLSRERYPSTMNPDSADNWTRRDFQTEYKDVESLKAYALRTIKQYAYPLLTYTVDVQSSFLDNYKDINLGDTIKIVDNNFRGGLALEARVSEMIISFDNPTNNSVVFTNFRKLDNKPSSELQQRIDEIVSKSLPYKIEIRTTNGTAFKNGIGSSTVKPVLKQGDKIVNATYRFVIDGSIVSSGLTYTVKASDITKPTVITISAWVDNKEVASEEITFLNVSDGKQGPMGPQGPQGPKGDRGNDGLPGKDGVGLKTTTITYGLSDSDSTQPANWSSQVPTLIKGKYLWTKTTWTYTDNSSETGYQKTYIAKDGNDGNDGLPGKDGVGIRNTTITYAAGTSGTVAPTSGWSSQVPNVPESNYLWTKTVWEYTDNTNETGYSVAKMGEQGPKGDRGNDGKTTYFHTAWSYSADGTDRFSTVYPNLNLLVNSSAKTKDGFFKNFDKVENGYGEVTITGTNTWVSRDMWDGFSIKPRDYKPGDKYTMSMDVMFTSWNLPAGTHLDEFWIGQRYGNNSWKRICFIDLPKDPSKMLNQWVRITQTSTIPPYEDPAIYTEACFLTKFTGPSEGSFTIRIRKPKQEPGETATPYMPSASEATTADYPSFIGHYTDYTQVDSPNPRDYTWSLIRGNDGKDGANGGENLIVNSAFPEGIDGWGFWDESTPNINLHIATHGFYYNGTKPLFRLDNNTNGVVPASTKRFPVKRNTDYSLNIQIFATGNLKSVDIYFLGRKANELTKVIHLKTHTGSPSTTQTVKWHLTFNSGDCDEGFIRILNNGTTDGNTSMLFFAELDCYEGTGDRAWQASSKDLEEELDTKADDVLTQAQLNRLNETNSIIKAELDAKASLDKLNQWVEAYQDFVNSNNANRAQAEKNLADASARVTKLENDLNDMSERWNFIDSYMTASNEGLVVGKKDNSSSIMFNPNGRISMFSAGHEVMYISQGVIHIENGIFSKTIQIGRYREEQDLLNPDRNVIRYVGGA